MFNMMGTYYFAPTDEMDKQAGFYYQILFKNSKFLLKMVNLEFLNLEIHQIHHIFLHFNLFIKRHL